MDRRAWRATVHRITQSRTCLEQLGTDAPAPIRWDVHNKHVQIRSECSDSYKMSGTEWASANGSLRAAGGQGLAFFTHRLVVLQVLMGIPWKSVEQAVAVLPCLASRGSQPG